MSILKEHYQDHLLCLEEQMHWDWGFWKGAVIVPYVNKHGEFLTKQPATSTVEAMFLDGYNLAATF